MNNCKHIITRLRMSKFYILFSVAQVLLSLAILSYIVIDPVHNMHQVVGAEILLTVSIFCDIMMRMISEDFFKDRWNIVDLVAFTGIVFLWVLFIKSSETIAVIDDLIGLVLMILRYMIQIVRIIILLKQSHKVKQLQQIDDIKFENVEKRENDDTLEKQIN